MRSLRLFKKFNCEEKGGSTKQWLRRVNRVAEDSKERHVDVRGGLSIERVYSSPTSGEYKESILELLKSSDHRQTPAAIWLENRFTCGGERREYYVCAFGKVAAKPRTHCPCPCMIMEERSDGLHVSNL